MGLRPRFKSQLKCPVALGPVVMLGPPPSGPTEEHRWWSWGPLLQSPPEGRSLDTPGNAAQREVGQGVNHMLVTTLVPGLHEFPHRCVGARHTEPVLFQPSDPSH